VHYADWLDDLIARARRRDPIPCAGCGKPYDRADMLEATLPSLFVRATPEFPVDLDVSSLAWVGPCCAELANQWQPGDPEPGP
jgi:hypothetical protein